MDTDRNASPQPGPRTIAHVNYSPGGGIDLKIRAEALAARSSGIPLHFYLMNQKETWDRGNLHSRARNETGRGPLRYLLHNVHKCRALEPILAAHDGLILRFPKVPLSYPLLFARYGRRIVTEHHTDEVGELRTSRLFRRRLLSVLVSIASGWILRRAAGITAITDELRLVELCKAGHKPSRAIGNGVGVQEIAETGFRPYDGRTLRLIFVASWFQPWHGIDRLLAAISAYDGEQNIELDVVGEVDDRIRAQADSINLVCNRRVILEGPCYGDQLNERFRQANVAVASLALHRNRMFEGSTLKVREYMARGIPFVLGYSDPDVAEAGDSLLRVPADESHLDLAQIVAFAERTSRLGPSLSASMRKFARDKLDWSAKVREMYDFALRTIPGAQRQEPPHVPEGASRGVE